jgi:hypothetical protein
MDITIDRLHIQLSTGFAPEQAHALSSLIGEALQAELRPYASNFTVTPAGYQLQSIVMPSIRLNGRETDKEIAQVVANELVHFMLQELESI